MKALVTHVLGARPNFMKAAPVIRALGESGVEQTLVHTGQHYDARMSDVFFQDLGLPEPDVNLHVGSGMHGEQTAAVLAGVERELAARRPALLAVYGDVNSTLGAALAAAKLHVPIAHVEAGLRSFDNTMPEEINRRLTDQLCELLFVTSPEAIGYLANEGIAPGVVHFVGNTMIDTLVACLGKLDAEAARAAHGLPERYMVATLHRPFNVDSPEAAALLVKAMHQVADEAPIIMPVHPRGRAAFEAAGLAEHPGIRMCEPLGYLEFMSLVRGAAAAITDSAGVQEETTFLRVPCLTLRPMTERPVTVTSGSNRLVRTDELASAVEDALAAGPYAGELPPLWDGASGLRIARIIDDWLSARFLSGRRGQRLPPSCLADALGERDGTGRVRDPVAPACDDLLVDGGVEAGVVGEIADDVPVDRDVPGRGRAGAVRQVAFPGRERPVSGDRTELERTLGVVPGGVALPRAREPLPAPGDIPDGDGDRPCRVPPLHQFPEPG